MTNFSQNYLKSTIGSAFAGTGKIGSFLTGAVTRENGDPSAARVEVSAMGGQRVSVVRSAADGSWEVGFLKMDTFYSARIHDPSSELNGAVLDWLQPVPM